ncbi:MAG: DCC1-like thiol-disulfide oxidoreductase family protein [Bacteroidetes bacterium]|nr:DCC1-like thiol-disulfide oxidoreductase family protein [Bacteroidota bacterium]
MNIILFDGVCNLCNNFVPFLIKYDKNNTFRFAAMQTNAGENIIQEYRVLNDRKSIILIKEEIVLYKSDAIIEIAKQITGWPSILKYGYLFPKFLRDGIYDLIAKNRYYLFGKKETCSIPPEKDSKRFIL